MSVQYDHNAIKPFYAGSNGINAFHSLDPAFKDAMSAELEESKEMIDLNVGGVHFQVLKSSFALLPLTRLSQLMRAKTEEQILSLCDVYIPGQIPQYFFNRNPTSFNCILDLYRIGTLHLTMDFCPVIFKEDLHYWRIDELLLDPCCAIKYYPEIENCFKEFQGEQSAKEREQVKRVEEDFGDSEGAKVRAFIWKITEYPETSRAAQVNIDEADLDRP